MLIRWFRCFMSVFSALFVIAAVVVQPALAEANEPASSDPIATWIEKLGSSTYPQREAAGNALRQRLQDADAAEPVIRQLGHTFTTTRDPEVRVRIKRLAEAYFRRHVLPERFRRPAFLGIATRAEQITLPPEARNQAKGDDQSDRKPLRGMRVERILPGTAAAEHGLQVGDLIIGINGQRFGADYAFARFTEDIRARGAGARVNFTIHRPNDDPPIREVPVTLGAVPRDMLDPAKSATLNARRAALREQWWSEAFRRGRARLPDPDPAPGAAEAEPNPYAETEPATDDVAHEAPD